MDLGVKTKCHFCYGQNPHIPAPLWHQESVQSADLPADKPFLPQGTLWLRVPS